MLQEQSGTALFSLYLSVNYQDSILCKTHKPKMFLKHLLTEVIKDKKIINSFRWIKSNLQDFSGSRSCKTKVWLGNPLGWKKMVLFKLSDRILEKDVSLKWLFKVFPQNSIFLSLLTLPLLIFFFRKFVFIHNYSQPSES